MKIKCPLCKKSFNKNTYVEAIFNCPKWTCGLKESTTKK